ncbi:MAG: 50S ribosomal protein L13 [Candidatus Taylorbacteria bacterium RIFCSPHIGHO2_02_FULL_45_28]|uniref:50S ribosomal protein L13 n=1 Tax=Candidatus Taylorbacteria bacterium RIFCSPHIGHO2_12_FULL_45_16 TaxID=1802315 RepID=A0A1G2N1L1_9BACT|nr:MAG: 50S ribosomal protein L13 [Candidatus Taylorbacteria bacterium RIFCSPHIGHO2_01_FULL_44_110]OHA25555.1 MAG: 50S ribosomal protein L13 [Candidatus Taylorbacteria bacterium RIFCSPHIGHO2_02_FULL_45_28]OHA29222.1 MAG: 50S ribosomal protein L13 [Candidatus Taylorbacteria bacterium RIFCSPHIGHO2_12_FULL_45_16]OHA33444.1 MAG: 50S ribosomal protein L13 [Candidatus Taylorbacteria bacterium RIFCSPLOWO2_01_FULL_45_59]OHA39225.1 MAG: 50S ribosomal protein L13 [Candidatus Taylorbacteria bacterium RIFC
MKHTIDAQGKKIGRIASQAAVILLGKHSPAFAKNKVSIDTVEIVNASKVDLTLKKKINDIFVTYTGFRGGLKNESLGELIARRGMTEVFRRAVTRMLPNNRLRDERIKNLTIKE